MRVVSLQVMQLGASSPRGSSQCPLVGKSISGKLSFVELMILGPSERFELK